MCVLLGASVPSVPSLLLVPPLSLKDLEEVKTKFHQKMSWYKQTVQCIEESKRLLKVSWFMDGLWAPGLAAVARLRKTIACIWRYTNLK